MKFNISPAMACYPWNEVQGLINDLKFSYQDQLINLVFVGFCGGFVLGVGLVCWLDRQKMRQK